MAVDVDADIDAAELGGIEPDLEAAVAALRGDRDLQRKAVSGTAAVVAAVTVSCAAAGVRGGLRLRLLDGVCGLTGIGGVGLNLSRRGAVLVRCRCCVRRRVGARRTGFRGIRALPSGFGLPSAAGPCGGSALVAGVRMMACADGSAASAAMPVLIGAAVSLAARRWSSWALLSARRRATGVAAATAAASSGSACAIASAFAAGWLTGAAMVSAAAACAVIGRRRRPATSAVAATAVAAVGVAAAGGVLDRRRCGFARSSSLRRR